ncbi:MAG: cytochrome c biogenesis protein CcsA [Deltaproteobacteria bacterium]|nr:cytochrome c biogenesis protein CcsA [Deltaproteobacteria bacterium]
MHLSCILGVMTFYLGATLVYLFQRIFSGRNLRQVAFRILLVGFILHTALLFYYLFQNGYPFFISANYGLHFVSWVMVLLFLLLANRFHLEAIAPLLIPTALIFYLISLFEREAYSLTASVLKSPWALVHFLFMFLAIALFLLGFAIGVAFLLQESRLKGKKSPFPRLPSLEVMDEMHSKASGVGFILLTIGIASGIGLLHQVRGIFFSGDSKQWGALVAWFLYLVFLNVRMQAGCRGRRAVLLSLLGLSVIILTFLGFEHH